MCGSWVQHHMCLGPVRLIVINVMHTHPGDLYSQNDMTPLASAIAKKHSDVVKRLVQLKANINVAGRVSRVRVGVRFSQQER